MKALASEMINKCANCTYQCFDSYMQRARRTTDYVLPSEVCVMINVIFSSKSRATKLTMDSGEYKYHSKLDETLETMLKDMETCIEDKVFEVCNHSARDFWGKIVKRCMGVGVNIK
ncbi:unnamed protein product [Gongylonema pulchrum]|uniref:DUF1041 domain-containing protein n=1 Tax=Gongylonema pulchrum TaxID=637853 RepID=A0A183EP35_9BILA|nr:unnamed protein product [Gongylonema pulchrum]